ncbi:CG11322, partial [Drosophila busckii]
PLIYLNLRQPVAIVSSKPTADPRVDDDVELQKRMKKLLGLASTQRRLYNPMQNYDIPDDHMIEDTPALTLSSRLYPSSNAPTFLLPKVNGTINAVPSPMRAVRPAVLNASTLTDNISALILHNIVQRANADYFESQTPQHLKEPIDLNDLPSTDQRAHNCKKHQKIISQLQPNPELYSFIDSLRRKCSYKQLHSMRLCLIKICNFLAVDTPLNLCHPLALSYRHADLTTNRSLLARTLFDVLNHQIFYCGLHANIRWQYSMNRPSVVEHSIDAGGKRCSRIILWKNIKEVGMLIEGLLHEMCHAAAFVFHGETGHGDNCRKWAYRAKTLLPELPQVPDCEPSYKYSCLLCGNRSTGSVKFEDQQQQLRCYYCQFELHVDTCSIDNIHNLSLTEQQVTPFRQYVRENYLKCPERTYSAKLTTLNAQYMAQAAVN